ncbi:MAG: recombinase family protein [Flavobacteriales bacterium]|nr:recombinase family protein [Flavobacteriales bacterium]
MVHIAYLRVSTVDQNTDRQLADTGINFDNTFTDKCSGSTTKRPELMRMDEFVRKGDTIHVHSIDRLARNTANLLELVTNWNDRGVSVVIHKENMKFTNDTNDATSKLMLTILGAVADFELSMIKERQREGIEQAKARGVYKGGAHQKTKPEVRENVLKLLDEGVSIRKTAARLNIGLSTVSRIKKADKEEAIG